MAGEVAQILELAVKKEFLTQEQIEECSNIHTTVNQSGLQKTLLQVIFEKGYISRERLNQLKTELGLPIAEIGNYGILSKLGQGGMGTVYKAQRLSDGKVVAIKVLSQHIKDKEHIERFAREIAAGIELRHPNIVNIIDSGAEKDTYFYVMEYIEGKNLDNIIEDEGGIEEPQAIEIIKQIADALDYASKKGLVHRDIKPANIIIANDGIPRLCDFGIAKFTTGEYKTLTQTGVSLSTPQYASPEQAKGEKNIDVRSDLYSLGVTLFHMVTGRVPFEGDESAVILMKHINKLPPSPKKINPKISDSITNIILRLMEKQPIRRYQTPTDLITALNRAGQRVTTREELKQYIRQPTKRFDRTKGYAKKAGTATSRSPSRATFIAIAATILIIVIIAAIFTEKSPAKTASWYYDKGLAEHKSRNYKEAIENYNEAININPNYVDAYFTRAAAKGKLKDNYGAIEDFDKIIELSPNDAHAYWGRGNAKHILGDYKGEIEDLDKAINIDPHFPDCGNIKYDDYRGEIEYLDRVININSSNANAYVLRAYAKHFLRDYEGAIKDLDKAISINPKYVEAYKRRGDAKHILDNNKGAITDYDKAIELSPSDAEAYKNRSSVKGMLEDYNGEIADLDKVLKLTPNDAIAYMDRVIAKAKLGDQSGAIADCDKVIELNPNDAVAYKDRGEAKIFLHDYKGCIADCDKAIQINPNYTEAYTWRGMAKGNLGDYKSAIADYDKIIALDPKDAGAYHDRGNAKDSIGDYVGAVADWGKAIELDPDMYKNILQSRIDEAKAKMK